MTYPVRKYPVAVLWSSDATTCLATACETCTTPVHEIVFTQDYAAWLDPMGPPLDHLMPYASEEFFSTATYGLCRTCDDNAEVIEDDEGVDVLDDELDYAYA